MSERNKTVFSANLIYFMNLNNISRQQLCEALNIKYSTLSEWLHARKYPRIDKIEQLAAYFGITKAALIEEHETSTRLNDLAHLTDVFNDMNESGQRALVDYADFLHSKPENKKSDTVLPGIAE